MIARALGVYKLSYIQENMTPANQNFDRNSCCSAYSCMLLGINKVVRLDFDRSVYLFIRFCFVDKLWECESKLDQCFLYSDFELDL